KRLAEIFTTINYKNEISLNKCSFCCKDTVNWSIKDESRQGKNYLFKLEGECPGGYQQTPGLMEIMMSSDGNVVNYKIIKNNRHGMESFHM
ncbi:hypothetical protein KY334_01560, partial [Candidatus Woesearchaeota archaeon]|nr:hypothetical protein [Candidatus Woesearchaeota archaeon]